MDTNLFSGYFQSRNRYSDAYRNSMWQEAIMQQVMAIQGIEEKWQSKEIEDLILEKIERK